MTKYFRTVEFDTWVDPVPSWLAEGDAVGNQVSDLSARMEDNTVSVYALPDLDSKTIIRVAAALQLKWKEPLDTAYLILDDALLERAAAEKEAKPGLTGDPEVDSWHVDLVRVSGSGLTRLAVGIRELDPERLFAEDIEAELLTAIRDEMRIKGTPHIEKHLRKKYNF